MRTQRLRAESDGDVREAARLLREGALVAFATETVYGLGANALDATAVARIFAAKERPSWDPLIVHVALAAEVGRVARVDRLERRVEQLAAAFWPGPLTMLLPRLPVVPDAVAAGRERVGVRVPGHAGARRLLELAGVPVAAPSANRFGHTSPTTAQHVLDDLDGRIDAVLDEGPAMVGVESTVLDVAETPLRIYRPGAVTVEAIAAVVGEQVELYMPAGGERREALPSPGVGLRHYAPRAQLVLVGGEEELVFTVQRMGGGEVGAMLPAGWDAGGARAVFPWGEWDDAAVLARRVFAGLRALDAAGVAVIVCPVPEGGGLRAALRDRLRKAAMPK